MPKLTGTLNECVSVKMRDVPDQTVLDAFNVAGRAWLRVDELFDRIPQFAGADIIRTVDRLMHDRQLLVRRTIGGTDQVILTERGAALIGLAVSVPEKQRMAEKWEKISELPTPFGKYRVHVEGLARKDGTWAGRIVFGDGADTRATSQETSQPNRQALEYWATGLEPIYLEGALSRTK